MNKMKAPRFTEIPTIMRAPLAESFNDLDIAMIGVPPFGHTGKTALVGVSLTFEILCLLAEAVRRRQQ